MISINKELGDRISPRTLSTPSDNVGPFHKFQNTNEKSLVFDKNLKIITRKLDLRKKSSSGIGTKTKKMSLPNI